MSNQLGYSTFQDVLFPPEDGSLRRVEDQNLHLRRTLRYTPQLDTVIRDASLIVFDTETTGLDASSDRIIEIGAQKLVGLKVVDEFSALITTDVPLSDTIIKLTGIRPEDLEGQPSIEEILPKFLEFIDGSILVAHNADFDMGMLRATCGRAGIDLEWPAFCTLKLAQKFLPDLERKDLDTLAGHYKLTFESRHRAIGDVKVTSSVMKKILAAEASMIRTWQDMQNFKVG